MLLQRCVLHCVSERNRTRKETCQLNSTSRQQHPLDLCYTPFPRSSLGSLSTGGGLRSGGVKSNCNELRENCIAGTKPPKPSGSSHGSDRHPQGPVDGSVGLGDLLLRQHVLQNDVPLQIEQVPLVAGQPARRPDALPRPTARQRVCSTPQPQHCSEEEVGRRWWGSGGKGARRTHSLRGGARNHCDMDRHCWHTVFNGRDTKAGGLLKRAMNAPANERVCGFPKAKGGIHSCQAAGEMWASFYEACHHFSLSPPPADGS